MWTFYSSTPRNISRLAPAASARETTRKRFGLLSATAVTGVDGRVLHA